MLEGSSISPFSQCGLDEAFGFAVGLRGVRLNPDVLDSELFASAGEGLRQAAQPRVSMLVIESWRSPSSAAVLPHIPDDSLATLIQVHMLDTHKLGDALAQTPERL